MGLQRRNGEHAQIGPHDLLCTEFCVTLKSLAYMVSECNSMEQTYTKYNSLLSNNTSNVLQCGIDCFLHSIHFLNDRKQCRDVSTRETFETELT